MLKRKLAVLMATCLIASCVGAENTTEAGIKKAVEPLLGGAKIESIKETPYSGLYELHVGGTVLYTDKKGEYLFQGRIIQTKTSQDLTAARIDDLNKIKFSELPLNLAIKQVHGDGKRVIAVFEDPNCGYCKRLRQTALKNLDNVTIYTFVYNILSDDSVVKSRNILCSADPAKAWDDWMVNGKMAPPAPEKCETPNDKVLALGQKLHINGTPAIFFTDGSRIPGAVDQKTLEAKLASIK